MFFPEIAQQASKRWRAVPRKAPSRLELARAPSQDQAAQQQKRLARLNSLASSEKARALVLAADTAPQAKASQSDVIRTIGFERVIGSRDIVDINFLELAIAMSRSVGRMHMDNEFATGFLVGPRLLMTNHHVIGDPQTAARWLFELDYQENATGNLLPVQAYHVTPDYFFCTDETLDYTVVGIADTSDKQRPLSAYPWIKLIGDLGKAEVGDPVNIIQHPNGGLKQIAFRQNQVISVSNAQPDFLDYSTDTEPGSSGSPCFNDQWELIALHHSGVSKTDSRGNTLKKNGQVWHSGDDPNDIDWIGNEGVRISAIVKSLEGANLSPAFRPLRDRLLTMNAPNPIELARALSSDGDTASTTTAQPTAVFAPQGESVPNNNSVTLQIPLTITVSVGGAAGQSIATVPGVAAAAPGAELEAVVIDPDWKAREGYQTDFLGVEVPLPQLSAGQLKQTAIVSPDLRKAGRKYEQYELCYWNYSVLMNKRYRTAWFSAANVDGNHRFNLGPRKGDKWFVDPRISAAEQLSQDAFETGIDRGHLTRREDAAWGDTAAIATKSCNDTFHFTNCSLQASAFNRGKDRWQGLEQFLLEKHAEPEKRRMVVITGPVFNTKDPTYRNSKMDASVPCPLQFWKVCVLLKAGNGLSATGFILGQQDIAQLSGFEAFDVGAAQITLAQLEAKTNLKFGNLKQYDHFAKTGEKGALEVLVEGSKQRFLHSFDEIVV